MRFDVRKPLTGIYPCSVNYLAVLLPFGIWGPHHLATVSAQKSHTHSPLAARAAQCKRRDRATERYPRKRPSWTPPSLYRAGHKYEAYSHTAM